MIIQDLTIREKYHKGFPRKDPPNEIVLHGTAGGGTFEWMLRGARAKEYENGLALFHYLIELDGQTIEIINPDNYVYHSSSRWHDKRTIGIELVNPDKNNAIAYNEFQYLALYDLLIELFERYQIEYLTSHKRNAAEYSHRMKECPGNFEWSRLEQWLSDASFDYSKIHEQYYRINNGISEED